MAGARADKGDSLPARSEEETNSTPSTKHHRARMHNLPQPLQPAAASALELFRQGQRSYRSCVLGTGLPEAKRGRAFPQAAPSWGSFVKLAEVEEKTKYL